MTPSPNKKSGGTQTIVWWVLWITLTIGSFFVASAIWSPIIYRHFGSVRQTHAAAWWVASVFGTWILFLVPLIVVMYSKVDKAYEDARIRREKNAARFRSIEVAPAQRALPETLCQKLKAWPPIIQNGHLVNLTLRDGRKIENVFISERREILGLYNASGFSFQGSDVTDMAPVDLKEAPAFLANLWLRLDGVQAPN